MRGSDLVLRVGGLSKLLLPSMGLDHRGSQAALGASISVFASESFTCPNTYFLACSLDLVFKSSAPLLGGSDWMLRIVVFSAVSPLDCLVHDDPTCLGFRGPSDVEDLVCGNYAVFIHRIRLLLELLAEEDSSTAFALSVCTQRSAFVWMSTILLRPLISLLSVAVDGVYHAMCPW